MKKIVGVTPRNNIIYETEIFNVYQNYFEAIIKAGALPIMLPQSTNEDLEELITKIDGLLITGGNDINPVTYNEKNIYSESGNDKEDANDINLINLALKYNKPILGICRGLQIINVAFNGSLYQDINKQNASDINHNQLELDPKPSKNSMIYKTNFKKDTPLFDIFNESYTINSYHHQAIKKLGEGLEISAISDDGIIEGIYYKDKIVAVQWHPERLIYDEKHFEIFKRFVSSL